MNAYAIAAAVLISLLLTGCAGFSGIEPSAKFVQPESLGMTAAPPGVVVWPRHDWWTDFGDAELDNLIEEAIGAEVPTLRLARARLAKANAVTDVSQAANRVGINLAASTTREKFSEHYIYPPPIGGSTLSIDQVTVNFSYDLDFWGKNQATIDSALAQARAADADTHAAELALTTSMARAWFQLKRLFAEREITLAAVKQRTGALELTQQRVSAGLDTNVELRQAEATVPIARVELGQIDEAIALVRNQIAALLGKGPERGARIAPAAGFPQSGSSAGSAVIPDNLPADLIGRRPDIVAARWRAEAAARGMAEAKAEFYPNVNLAAAVGLISLGSAQFLTAGSKDASIGPALSLPLLSGRLRANLRGRNADYDAAVEQYNQTLIDAVREVSDQVASLKAAGSQLVDQSLARSKSEQAYQFAQSRYKAGISNYLTVLTAQTIVLSQQRAEVALRARVTDLRIGLIRALGGGYEPSIDYSHVEQQATTIDLGRQRTAQLSRNTISGEDQ